MPRKRRTFKRTMKRAVESSNSSGIHLQGNKDLKSPDERESDVDREEEEKKRESPRKVKLDEDFKDDSTDIAVDNCEIPKETETQNRHSGREGKSPSSSSSDDEEVVFEKENRNPIIEDVEELKEQDGGLVFRSISSDEMLKAASYLQEELANQVGSLENEQTLENRNVPVENMANVDSVEPGLRENRYEVAPSSYEKVEVSWSVPSHEMLKPANELHEQAAGVQGDAPEQVHNYAEESNAIEDSVKEVVSLPNESDFVSQNVPVEDLASADSTDLVVKQDHDEIIPPSFVDLVESKLGHNRVGVIPSSYADSIELGLKQNRDEVILSSVVDLIEPETKQNHDEVILSSCADSVDLGLKQNQDEFIPSSYADSVKPGQKQNQDEVIPSSDVNSEKPGLKQNLDEVMPSSYTDSVESRLKQDLDEVIPSSYTDSIVPRLKQSQDEVILTSHANSVEPGWKQNQDEVMPISDEKFKGSSEISEILVAPTMDETSSDSVVIATEEEAKLPQSSTESAVGTDNEALIVKDLETHEHSEEQPLIASHAQPMRQTSWKSCCGLFYVLSGGSSR